MRSLRLLWIVVATAMFVCGWGQIPSLPKTPEVVADSDLSSPAQAVSVFWDAMSAEPPNFDRARDVLDLREENLILARSVGESKATKLYSILIRIPDFSPVAVKANEAGNQAEISIRRDGGSFSRSLILEPNVLGEWRFTEKTIAEVDEIFDLVSSWPVRTGFSEVTANVDRLVDNIEGGLAPGWSEFWLFDLKRWQAVAIPILLVAAFLIGYLVRTLVRMVIRLRLKSDSPHWPTATQKQFGKGASFLAAGLIFRFTAYQLGLPGGWISFMILLGAILIALGFVFVGLALNEVVISKAVETSLGKSDRAQRLIAPLFRNFGRAFIIGIALIYFLYRIGIDITTMVAGLGIGGLVLALAAKDSVENLFGSITVLMDMPFKIGDWVKVDGMEGTIEEISIRSTKIRTFEDSLILVPNRLFISSPVENMGQRRFRRFKTIFGLGYGTSPELIDQFIGRIRDYLSSVKELNQEKTFVNLRDFAPTALTIDLRTYMVVETFEEEAKIRQDVMMHVIAIADEMGLDFASELAPFTHPA